MTADLLASPEWLQEHLSDPTLVVVDCSSADSAYGRAHIPGAVRQSGHHYVKSKQADGSRGLFLPSPQEFVALAQELGIGPQSTVVTYDDGGTLFAARLWWVLRYYGHAKARVLDGGWQGWIEAGYPVSCETPAPPTGVTPLTPNAQAERLATLEQLRESLGKGEWQPFDTRSDGEFRGEEDRGNKRAGHVPGAVHFEWKRCLTHANEAQAVRLLRPADELRGLLDEAGLSRDSVAVSYCQAGIRAALGAFVLELLGYPTPRLYDGSMSEWANRDDTPLE